jgi:hypothetical protein
MVVSRLSHKSHGLYGLLTGLELHCDGLVGALHEESASFGQSGCCARRLQAIFQHIVCARGIPGRVTYLTSFMVANLPLAVMCRVEYKGAVAEGVGGKAIEGVWIS